MSSSAIASTEFEVGDLRAKLCTDTAMYMAVAITANTKMPPLHLKIVCSLCLIKSP